MKCHRLIKEILKNVIIKRTRGISKYNLVLNCFVEQQRWGLRIWIPWSCVCVNLVNQSATSASFSSVCVHYQLLKDLSGCSVVVADCSLPAQHCWNWTCQQPPADARRNAINRASQLNITAAPLMLLSTLISCNWRRAELQHNQMFSLLSWHKSITSTQVIQLSLHK